MLFGDGARRARVARGVGLDAPECFGRALDVFEGEEPFSFRQVLRPAGVLRDDGAARRHVAGRAAREPARPPLHVSLLGDGELAARALDERAIGAPVGRARLRVEHAPAGRTRMFGGERLARAARLPDGDGERHLRGEAGQVVEAAELDILLPPRLAAVLKRPRRRPVHQRRVGGTADPVFGDHRRRVRAPVREADGLSRGTPVDAAVGHTAVGAADVLAEREVKIVRVNEVAQAGRTRREHLLRKVLNLREHRVGVNKDAHGYRPVLVAHAGRAGDVEKDVRRAADLFNLLLIHAERAARSLVAVGPARREVEGVHHTPQVPDRRRGVAPVAPLRLVDRPQPRVLDVVNVVAQRGQSRRVLHVVPRHAARREQPHVTADDDAQPPLHACANPRSLSSSS